MAKAKSKARAKAKKGTVRPRITVDVSRDPAQGRLAVAVAAAAVTEKHRDETKPRELLELAYLTADALRDVLAALAPLEWDQKREVIRWAADHSGIDVVKLMPPAVA